MYWLPSRMDCHGPGVAPSCSFCSSASASEVMGSATARPLFFCEVEPAFSFRRYAIRESRVVKVAPSFLGPGPFTHGLVGALQFGIRRLFHRRFTRFFALRPSVQMTHTLTGGFIRPPRATP